MELIRRLCCILVMLTLPAFLIPGRSPRLGVIPNSFIEAFDSSTWSLIWNDEFDGPNGAGLDSSKWVIETGGGGWGNNELQYYTNRLANAYLDNGSLIIKAINERYTGPDGVTRNYTSARLKTQGKFTQTYGRFEARIKVPYGQGLWPAFWMLGNDIDRVSWPRCGEIDIMESIGREPTTIFGTAHGPGYSGASGITGRYTLPDGSRVADAYHLFSIEWEPQAIRWYIDGVLYHTVTPTNLPTGANWVFNHPFFLLLNVAVGGNFPGNPDATTIFPQVMQVDYVRVYQPRVASVSAASFVATAPLAVESIVSAFGANLASASQGAVGLPLPTSLVGTMVSVRDSTNVERLAPLFYVSPGQVNYQIPTGTATGNAIITISSGENHIAIGDAQIAAVAPGLFAANANGQGVAAAVLQRRQADGKDVFEPVAEYDELYKKFVARPLDLSNPTDQFFLLLFGTGIRHRSGLSTVTAQIGDSNIDVLFAGPQGDFVGLDQLNVRLPRSLSGRGEVDVRLTADGLTANPVKINIR